jgi:hypothetical protein
LRCFCAVEGVHVYAEFTQEKTLSRSSLRIAPIAWTRGVADASRSTLAAEARDARTMKFAEPISALLRRVVNARQKGVVLSELGERVVQQAQARGYEVERSTRQGPEAIVFTRNGEETIFMWSSEDVVAYGRSRQWI